jgi:hypothetical protein
LEGNEADYVDAYGFGFHDSEGNAEKEGYGDFHFWRLALWELDAIRPEELAKIVSTKVKALRSDHLWNEAVNKEKSMIQQLQEIEGKLSKGGGR